ncbi:hypothetical protein BDK51DRAFT_25478 [Blyttiomyces helicus]|uniref:Uncharacterized protein n=1 Tax=Blyttiomyces helicus TaxID=388810 RepID=A0A4P9WCE3_9FUNG|nr:hypothetical protein BDK51DRAFT_25478 [Blyttiomyces helicus]|eukprot:RKO88026.1 hypothetical protein BDK51DRAFT_25478 [Blyttiomyces helicus]
MKRYFTSLVQHCAVRPWFLEKSSWRREGDDGDDGADEAKTPWRGVFSMGHDELSGGGIVDVDQLEADGCKVLADSTVVGLCGEINDPFSEEGETAALNGNCFIGSVLLWDLGANYNGIDGLRVPREEDVVADFEKNTRRAIQNTGALSGPAEPSLPQQLFTPKPTGIL